MSSARLLIDQRSASTVPSSEAVFDWALGRRIFVSSLITDMPAEREATRRAIKAVGAEPVMFEELGAQDVPADQAFLSGVRSSAVYVGLWADRYGVAMTDGYSATHAEFLEAERAGLRLCVFVHAESPTRAEGPQRDLIQGARNRYTTATWVTPDDLGQRVEQRLRELAAEDIAPWIRLGRTVFRANEIVDDGASVIVEAELRSAAVNSELVGMRDGSAGPLLLVTPHSAQSVQFDGLESRTRSTTSFVVRIRLTRLPERRTPSFNVINGVAADELSRRAISDGTFSTELLGDQSDWALTRPIDPLAELRGLGLDDAVLRPAARLCFVRTLLKDGTAAGIDAFTLGPQRRGSRWLRVEWTPPRRFVNAPEPEQVVLEGEVVGL